MSLHLDWLPPPKRLRQHLQVQFRYHQAVLRDLWLRFVPVAPVFQTTSDQQNLKPTHQPDVRVAIREARF